MNAGGDEDATALNDVQTPWRKTVIALDFDRTFTSDIEFWRMFVTQAVRRGHTVLCVTGRTDSERSRNEMQALFGEYVFSKLAALIFCNHCPKRDYAANHGWEVDIWIDDFPESIGAPNREAIKSMEGVHRVYETLPVFDIKNVHPTNIWTDV
jgi:hypothetical protein